MRFLRPELLWLLLALPPVGLLGFALARRRRRALARFAGGSDRLDRFLGEVGAHRRALKGLLLLVAAAFGVLAAARPQWGSRLESVEGRGVDVVVVLDTSLSMACADVAPDRLAVAKYVASNVLEKLAGNRIGLVTFAGRATLSCPLTPDVEAVRLFLDATELDSVPVPGTALADALDAAIRAFGAQPGASGDRSRAVLLLSDGEDHEAGTDEALERLHAVGAVLYAVGVGTREGGPIPVSDAAGADAGYKKDAGGNIVTTRLDEDLLERIAVKSGGRYWQATPSGLEIDDVVAAVSELDTSEYGKVLRTRYEERYQIPLALALIALAAESLIPDRRAGRRSSAEGGA